MVTTRQLNDGWELSLAMLGDHLFARLTRNLEAYELILQDRAMLDLVKMGTHVSVWTDDNGEPNVVWVTPDGSPLYIWICPAEKALWLSTSSTI